MSNPFWNPYSNAENDIIRSGWEDNLSDLEIKELLAQAGYFRSLHSIKAQRHKLKLVHSYGGWRGLGPKPPAKEVVIKRIAADHAFKRAMLDAIECGKETAIVGVVKDRRPIPVSRFRAEPATSCMGSSMAQCSDA